MARNETPVALTAMGRLADMQNGRQPDQLWSVAVTCEKQNGEKFTLAEIVVANNANAAGAMAINKARARIDQRYAWVMSVRDERPLPLNYVDVTSSGRTRRVRTLITRPANRPAVGRTTDNIVIEPKAGEHHDA